jgi:hypothetical protein
VKFLFIRRTFIEDYKTCNRKFWKKANLSTEAPLGNLEGDGLLELLRDRWRPLEIEDL